jgi:hypothetical protein
MRTIAVTASVALIVIHWDAGGAWFWVVLVVLNLVGILTSGSQAARGGETVTGSRPPGDLLFARLREDGESHRMEELLSLPGVAAAFAAGPRLWHQVSYLDDHQFDPTTAEELAAFIWIENQDGWAIAVRDDVKPCLDLDIEETDDPLIRVLKAHPAVEDAFHEDREVYRIEHREPINTEVFAELAARAGLAPRPRSSWLTGRRTTGHPDLAADSVRSSRSGFPLVSSDGIFRAGPGLVLEAATKPWTGGGSQPST